MIVDFQKDVRYLLKMLQLSITKMYGLLRKYISDNGKIISSKITSVSLKQKKLTKEIKKAKVLGLL